MSVDVSGQVNALVPQYGQQILTHNRRNNCVHETNTLRIAGCDFLFLIDGLQHANQRSMALHFHICSVANV